MNERNFTKLSRTVIHLCSYILFGDSAISFSQGKMLDYISYLTMSLLISDDLKWMPARVSKVMIPQWTQLSCFPICVIRKFSLGCSLERWTIKLSHFLYTYQSTSIFSQSLQKQGNQIPAYSIITLARFSVYNKHIMIILHHST